ncbi:unnamed protein product, partial [Iphiclides podalirius]
MVESPQVTSTTGRGRAKGPTKPRKPRAKKEKVVAASQSLDQLPVSEDCVTAGTGLQSNSELDTDLTEDISNLDSSALSMEELACGKVKKPRTPRKTKERKPRAPKEPKTPKEPGEKLVKERKRREPRDPNAPKRKRNVKKVAPEIQADTTTSNDLLEKSAPMNNPNDFQTDNTVINIDPDKNIKVVTEMPSLDDCNVTDFDDIPVSKIAIKDLLEEAEAKREQAEREEDIDNTGQKKKASKKKSSGGSSCKKLVAKKTPSGKKKRRGGLIPESDGEPDDLITTPPPSPPPEGDDSLKRRSARNTQRKKYTDDVMLRLSDDEFTMSTPKFEKDSDGLNLECKDFQRPETTPKPNYIYVNTTEEDSMIVQHVLASRMGKRELKPEPPVSEQTNAEKPELLDKDNVEENEKECQNESAGPSSTNIEKYEEKPKIESIEALESQQKMVKIYRLICRNTYEREMFDKASLKLGLDKAILQSMNTAQGKEAGLKQLSKKEIEDLLKKGAYGAVMDEDNAGDKFCEEDIEMILARRTQVIQMESEKGSTFSKASFAATDQRSDIDIRDPDFWNKWAKKADIDTTEKKEDEDLIVTEPRKRTIIKRYGHDDGPMEMSDMEVTPDSEDDEEGISLRSKRKKEKLGRKGRRYASDDYVPRHEGFPLDEEVVYGSWTRSECFKIERGLLTFGWARWEEIIDKNQFRKGWTLPVIEDCARIIVLYCLRHYKGDEKIRNFIWDLIEPCENGEVTISRNHSGLHNPVPRGRNAKKKNRLKEVPKLNDLQKWEDPSHWSSTDKYDCEAYLESSYKKHLFRHANKVLLRVRMMYYIKHEVIGDYATQIENGVHASSLGMRVPRGVDSTPPRLWWDTECDVSLLVGTYIHGYENYLAMRSDPQLCFVDKLGPPDDAECTDIKSEERKVRGSVVGDEDCTDDVSSGAGATSPAASPRPDDDSAHASHLWPSMQDLNTRLRRLITAYQRNYKREELKMQQRAKMERRERMDQLARDEVSQWRWTRADEEAFRRTVASYGVEFDPATKSLRWNRFRSLARLDSKSDDALTDYLKAFMAMCKRQCGLSVGEAELPTRADLKAEPIGEERAIATLERIDLLRVLREEVAPHPALEARLALAERSLDTPPWWQPARHDKLLVLGVCKHGLGDTFNKIFSDPKLPFADCARKWQPKYKTSTKKEPEKQSSDEEDKSNFEGTNETRMSLRRSKRTSNICDRDTEEDMDALSELETLAKLGRVEESLSPDLWFSERALETRLHHIAHAVQNCEWPSAAPAQKAGESNTAQAEVQDERKQVQKRHIAIDVETERAKLHALLSSPQAAHTSNREVHRAGSSTVSVSASGGTCIGERDDASSDSGSRRSTPAPPPAHQRVAPSPAPSAAAASPSPSVSSASVAPVDLSAPLDLSEAQDFSLGRRTPQIGDAQAPTVATAATAATAAATPPRSRLDDTLSRLMKRKNVPAPEQIIGKEKKRKKLDEIVLDPYLLETLSKQTLNYDSALKAEAKQRTRDSDNNENTATDLSKSDKKKNPFESLRTQVPPEFAAVQEKLLKGDKKDIDISKMLLEQMASGALSASLVSSAEAKKNKEIEKEICEKGKTSVDYLSRISSEENVTNLTMAHKRTLEEISNEPENLALQPTAKKTKESSTSEVLTNVEKQSEHSTTTGEMDLEDLIAPSTVIKTGMKATDFELNKPNDTTTQLLTMNIDKDDKSQIKNVANDDTDVHDGNDNSMVLDCTNSLTETDKKTEVGNDESNSDLLSGDASKKGNRKKNRKSSEEPLISGPRRELRSSAGRLSTDGFNH